MGGRRKDKRLAPRVSRRQSVAAQAAPSLLRGRRSRRLWLAVRQAGEAVNLLNVIALSTIVGRIASWLPSQRCAVSRTLLPCPACDGGHRPSSRNPGNFPGFSSRARHVSTRQAQTTEPLRWLTVRSPNCRRGLPAAARSASCSRGRCSLRTPQTRAAPRAAATRRRAALGVSPDF